MLPELAIADSADSRQVRCQVAAPVKGRHLLQQTRRHHLLKSQGDALVQDRALPRADGYLHHPVLPGRHRLALLPALPLGHGDAAAAIHLQCPPDALGMPGVDSPRGIGVHLREAGMQPGPAVDRRLRLDLTADVHIRRWHICEPLEESPEIEHGAPHQQRDSAPAVDLAHQAVGIRCKIRRRVGIGGVPYINQVMRVIGLGTADIQPPVNQGRIHADQLAIAGPGELYGQVGLAGGRGAHQADNQRPGVAGRGLSQLVFPSLPSPLRAPASATAQEQLVQLIDTQLGPGGPAVVALAGAFGFLHVPQQGIHFRYGEAAIGPHRAVAGHGR